MITLYKITATKAVQTWTISHQVNMIRIKYGQLNGAMQTQVEMVSINNSGRSLTEQIKSRIDSRVNKQLDKGYRYTIEEAQDTIGLNASNLVKPMLAQKFRDIADIDYDSAYAQYKYNGHRCLIAKIDGVVFAYSRNGKPVPGAQHVIESLQHMDEGIILDGELYVHGMSLQQIGSLARKAQPESTRLQYIIYDVVKDWRYSTRLHYLCSLNFSAPLVVAPTSRLIAISVNSINERLDNAIAQGYEGLILRQDKFGYEPGKRSRSLIKLKKCDDAEFEVVAIHESADGWAILECAINDRTFRVSAPGTIAEKTKVLKNKDEYIGKLVTVEYFEITDDGIPFHPVAINFREDL